MKDMMIGADLAKTVFQVHGALQTGEAQFRKKLTRKQFLAFMAKQDPCLVIFEACGGAHYWARQPEMRFVATKTVEQQSRAAVFRGRERLVHQRTEDVNALRALLYEHGHVFPAGVRSLDRMAALLGDDTSGLPALIREECKELLAQIAEKTARIAERNKKLSALTSRSARAVRQGRCRAMHLCRPC